jgi:hypothetical protein
MILLFHSSTGIQLNDTTNANDLAIQVSINSSEFNSLDFASLVPPGVQGLTILRVEFYIELPQSMRNMMDGNNQPYHLISWLGNADLRAMSAADDT